VGGTSDVEGLLERVLADVERAELNRESPGET
jgi:hypothetical protein